MANKTKPIFNKLLFSGIILLIILIMQPVEVFYFIKDIAVLLPKGEIGIKQRNLLIFIQAAMLIFIIPVYIITFVFSWWYRSENKKATYDPHLVDHKIAEFIWWGLPLVFTLVVSAITWVKTHELDPYKPIESDKDPITIEVVALQWKWLFMYPEEEIATINYIRIPKDTPVRFKITADAPMNSFWIPSLGGQIYAMPGMETQLNLIANEEGKFRGSSANISGKGFAGMVFFTESSSDDAYEEWVKTVQQSNKSLDWSEYEKIAAPSENNPVELYQLKDSNLFNEIIMKFMKPQTPKN